MVRRKKYKRIYNPVTGKYYNVEVRPDGSLRIIGLSRPRRKKKKSIWDIFG